MTFGDSRLPDRFWSKVIPEPNTGCWLWTGATNGRGRGNYRLSSETPRVYSYRLAYQALVGPIPDGLQIDHVVARGCCGPICVNPGHLEPVTPRENTIRGDSPRRVALLNGAKTHCIRGHALSGENLRTRTNGHRQCKECQREAHRLWKSRRKGNA